MVTVVDVQGSTPLSAISTVQSAAVHPDTRLAKFNRVIPFTSRLQRNFTTQLSTWQLVKSEKQHQSKSPSLFNFTGPLPTDKIKSRKVV